MWHQFISNKMLVTLFISILKTCLVQGLFTNNCLKECGPDISSPVCGSDGQTYETLCLFEIGQCFYPDLELHHLGECRGCENEDTFCGEPGDYGYCRTVSCRPDESPSEQGKALCPGKNCLCCKPHKERNIFECLKKCPKIFIPLCGSDGRTFGNKCIFEIEQCINPKLFLKHLGQCKDIDPSIPSFDEPTTDPAADDFCQRDCPKHYEPVCGSDNITYPNKCSLMIGVCRNPKLRVKHLAHCSADVDTLSMLMEWKNINDSKNNDNSDESDNTIDKDDLQMIHDESVKVPNKERCLQECPRTYEPVCGTDNITYPNNCMLSIGVCINPELQVKHSGPCPHDQAKCLKVCNKDLSPVCGSNGRTYGNLCVFEIEQCKNPYISFAHFGTCREYLKPLGEDTPGLPAEWKVKSDNETNENDAKSENAEETDTDEIITLPTVQQKLFADSKYQMCMKSCTKELNPVCGADGKNYGNKCIFDIEQCRNKELKFAHFGKCKKYIEYFDEDMEGDKCTKKCLKELYPVCGSNGKSYGNKCFFEIQQCKNPDLKFIHFGTCKEYLPYMDEDTPELSTERTDNINKEINESDAKFENDEQIKPLRFVKLPEDDSCKMECIKYFRPICAKRRITLSTRCQLVIQLCNSVNLRKFFEVPCTKEPYPSKLLVEVKNNIDEKTSESKGKNESKEKILLDDFMELPSDDLCMMDCIKYFRPSCAKKRITLSTRCQLVFKICKREKCTPENY